jgi:hypothetical protein
MAPDGIIEERPLWVAVQRCRLDAIVPDSADTWQARSDALASQLSILSRDLSDKFHVCSCGNFAVGKYRKRWDVTI